MGENRARQITIINKGKLDRCIKQNVVEGGEVKLQKKLTFV